MGTDIEQLLQMAKECELGMKRSYDHFSEIFKDNSDASQLWNRLSHDEEEHMKLITEIIRVLTSEQKSQTADISQIDPIQKQIEFMDSNPYTEVSTLNGALAYTKKLEDFEVSSIVQMLMKGHYPSDERSKLLHKQLTEHYKELQKYFEKDST